MEWGNLSFCLRTTAKRILPNRIKIPKEPRDEATDLKIGSGASAGFARCARHTKAVNLQGCLFLF